jgi:hypothetical protein
MPLPGTGVAAALGGIAFSTFLMGCGVGSDPGQPPSVDVESVTAAQTIQSMGTAAYDTECSNANVPLPPKWGTSTLGDGLNGTWKDNGTYPHLEAFFGIEGGHVYYSRVTTGTKQGICVLNTHETDGCAGGLVDLICQGVNGKACFWEGNITPTPQAPPFGPIDLLPVNLKGGTELNTATPMVTGCPSCHAGENAFIAHNQPGHALNLGSLWNPTSPNWMDPIVKSGSIQNPIAPTNQFADWPASSSNCTGCHVSGNGGRFPKISAYSNGGGFCGLVEALTNLPGSMQGMPPSSTCGVNGGACPSTSDPFVKVMLQACKNPIDPNTTPAVSSRGALQLEVFVTSHGQVRVRKYDDAAGLGWLDWADLPSLPSNVTAVSSPAATSWDSTRTDVFVLGSDTRLYHQFRNSGGWNGTWEQLDSGITSAPAVTNWGVNRLDVFALKNGILWHKWFQTNSWFGPETLFTGVPLYSPPAAVAWGNGRIDIVARRSAGNINQFFYSGGWFGPFDLGGATNQNVNLGISTFGVNRLDVFAVTGTQVKRRSFINVWDPGWTNVLAVKPPTGSGISAVSMSNNRIDILTDDASGVLMQGFSTTSNPSFLGWFGL